MKAPVKFALSFAVALVGTYFLIELIGNPFVISFIIAAVISVILVKDND